MTAWPVQSLKIEPEEVNSLFELQYCTTTSCYSFCRAVIDRQSIVGLTQKDNHSHSH